MPDAANQAAPLFASIVVGTDGSETAQVAVRSASELAAQARSQLHIVSAYEPVSPAKSEDEIEARSESEWLPGPHGAVLELLDQARTVAAGAGVTTVEIFARQGDAADAILDVAEEQQADLIVVGNKGLTGAKRFLLGSVPNRVSHYAPCSVLIVRTT